MAERLQVNLGDRSYAIHFDRDNTMALRSVVQGQADRGKKIAVLTDKNVAAAQRERVEKIFGAAPLLAVTAGEESKSFKVLEQVLDFLAAQAMDRTGTLFVLGGGVIGDLGGFAAAAWLRGIDFIQVPTTLLAMVDSSVGGKTGINLKAGKNLVGAFHQPRAVYISTDSLATLPAREFAAGAAEVIKYGLLGDPALFTQLEKETLTVKSPQLAAVIRRCCELKAQIVEADERETARDGGRALLNLGHTFGHAIEQVAGYGTYLHGEAVAIGLCAAARLSQKLGHLSADAIIRIEAVIAAHLLPTRLSAPLPLTALVAATKRDKKVRDGQPRFVVLKKIGTAATEDGVAPALAESAFREIGAT